MGTIFIFYFFETLFSSRDFRVCSERGIFFAWVFAEDLAFLLHFESISKNRY